VYINRQTAAAHHLIFKIIEGIVKTDTGRSLLWRHLHANSVREFTGILHWSADQHGGQAKGRFFLRTLIDYISHDSTGLGLHLKELAQKIPSRYDLHEPNRLISSLSEYDHLHRIFRLCHVHVFRNINDLKESVSENIKKKMKSLVCVEHPDFEGTLLDIERDGGKAGTGA
jgi:hypothetical protein